MELVVQSFPSVSLKKHETPDVYIERQQQKISYRNVIVNNFTCNFIFFDKQQLLGEAG